MKITLNLNEEQQGLRLIQVNDGFVVVDINKKLIIGDWVVEQRKNETPDIFCIKNEYTIAKEIQSVILFATPNLNLEGVPIIKEMWMENWEKVNNQIKEGVNPHAYRLGYIQAQQNLFTEDEVLLLIAEAITKFKLGKLHESELIKQSLKSLKQPKVEITFEENYVISGGLTTNEIGHKGLTHHLNLTPIKCVIL